MSGVFTNSGENIVVQNGDNIGLLIRPDGSILTPNGGGG